MAIKKKMQTTYITSDGTEFLSKKNAEEYEKNFNSRNLVKETTTRIAGYIRAIKEEEGSECTDYYKELNDEFEFILAIMISGFDNAYDELYPESESNTIKFVEDVVSKTVASFYVCLERNLPLVKGVLTILLQETENEYFRQKGKEYLKSIS